MKGEPSPVNQDTQDLQMVEQTLQTASNEAAYNASQFGKGILKDLDRRMKAAGCSAS